MALLSCLAACRSAPTPTEQVDPSWREAAARSQRQVHPPEPAPIRDAVFEGQIVDVDTGEGLEGATLLAEPRAKGSTEVAISDEHGDFRIALPSGKYSVLVYYADFQILLDELTIDSNETARREIGIDPAKVPNIEPLFPECPKVAPGFVASPADTEALIAAVLERFARDPSTVGSGREFPIGEPVYVATEIWERPPITEAALPRAGSRRFMLKTKQELRALADLRGMPFYYLGFITVDIAGDCASVAVDALVASPTGSNDSNGDGCTQWVLYEKRDGTWRYKVDSGAACP